MSDITTEQLNSILTYLNTNLQSATDWTLRQAPLVAQDLIHWTIMVGLVVLAVVLALSTIWTGILVYVERGIIFAKRPLYPDGALVYKLDVDDRVGATLVASLLYAIVMIFTWGPASPTLMNALQAWIAPRLFLLEYVTRMIGGNS